MEKPMGRAGLFTVSEKDEQYYRLWVEDNLQEIAQRCLGVRKWIQFRSAITILSRFGYFATNGLFANQTPGEEFCEAQVNDCSIAQRLLMILLNNDLRFPSEVPKPFVEMVKDVHMITFYLFGDFYQLSKRAMGVSYIDSSQTDNSDTSWKFELLNKFIGCVSMIKLMLLPQGDMQKVETSNDSRVKDKSDISAANSDMLCHLCSSPRREATSTLCGHVFCWVCIHDWMRQRNECPVCRTPTEPSRLVYLVNFR